MSYAQEYSYSLGINSIISEWRVERKRKREEHMLVHGAYASEGAAVAAAAAAVSPSDELPPKKKGN